VNGIRKATPADIPAIQTLIDENLDKLLPRDIQELKELLGSFWVYEADGRVVGCCCLEVYGPKIAELRTLAVEAAHRGRGCGEQLVRAALDEAKRRNIRQVLVVTSAREFFEKLNFMPTLNEKYALFWNGK
jgi:amino-acid N-acetyltransferase